jgi:Cu+-exporting ATPase
VSNSAASFGPGGGGFGGESGGGGGGGENGSDGGNAKGNLVAGGPEEASALSPDVIMLDVGV